MLERSKADQELAKRSGEVQEIAASAEELYNLVRQLREGAPTERVEAARRLQGCRSEAVPALCEALEGRDPALRMAAAQRLGEIGDERAVRPLLEALHRTRREVAADQRRTAVFLVAAALGGMGVAHWLGLATFAASPLLVALAGCGASLDGFRRRSSSLTCRIVEALARIAERRPAVALREAIPELHEVGSSFAQLDSSARDAILGTASRIDALTAELQRLPLPASILSVDAGAGTQFLPLPGHPQLSNEATQPRTVGG